MLLNWQANSGHQNFVVVFVRGSLLNFFSSSKIWFSSLAVFQKTKKYKPCGVILDSYNGNEDMKYISRCISRDDCVRVSSPQEDRTCHLIGHQYVGGKETCFSLDMTQWMKLWSNWGETNCKWIANFKIAFHARRRNWAETKCSYIIDFNIGLKTSHHTLS